MHAKVRLLRRIETRLSRTGPRAIEHFLGWATPQELWQLVPMLYTLLPPPLREAYPLLSSCEGLAVLYDSPGANVNFVPMLQLLLQRWRRVAPEQVDEVLSECRSILLHARTMGCTNAV